MIRPALLALVFAAMSAVPGFAKDDTWEVKGDLIGKKDKVTKDVSGIACATDTGFPRTCLIIDDNLQSAQVVTLTDGKISAGRPIRLIDDMLNDKALELDGEGVAYADNHFYVVGSHGRPRGDSDLTPAEERARVAARTAAASKLIRLRFDPTSGEIAPKPADVKMSTGLRALIDAEPSFTKSLKEATLENGGITIEGIAIHNKRLFAGFRGPVIDSKAVILSAALGHFFDGQAAEATLHLLPLGPGRGVRDLAAYDNGVLILAGPVQDKNGTYSIYRWDGVGNNVKRLKDLPDYFSKEEKKKKDGKQWKPEALLPLDSSAKGLRVLLLLDSAEEGKPRTERVPYP